MRRLLLLLPLLLGACAPPVGELPPRDPREAACLAEATRVVQHRERGQLMRMDETEGGRGTITVAPFARVEVDRAFAQMERDRLVQECLRAGAPP